MKRIGYLWNDFVSEENIIAAALNGTVNKHKDRAVKRLMFSEEEAAENPSLAGAVDPRRVLAFMRPYLDQLNAGTWQHTKPRYIHRYCKNRASSHGKWRDLYVPALSDHIIGHMAYSSARVAFERGMHPHCCGSVRGRGIMHIVRTVSRWLRTDPDCRYFVKLDIRHFFDSINPDLLMDCLRRKIKDEKLLGVFYQIIHASPSACPVGFFTSPALANLYLEKFDWFVEQELYKERRGKRMKWVRHYLRYMDDMLLVGSSKSDLYKAVRKIKSYLAGIGLELKKNWEIKKAQDYMIDIGGYKFCRDFVVLRDGIYLATCRLARKIRKRGYATEHDLSAMQSRFSWAGHADCYKFVEGIENVAKIRKRRKCKAGGNRKNEPQRNCSAELPADPGR